MESTSSLIKSVTRRVWSLAPPPQRPFRVCSHDRGTRKGVTAATLEELRERVCQALMLCLSSLAVVLVCEEDGTVVDSEDFLVYLPDNTVLMALEPGQTWKPPPGAVLSKGQDPNQSRTGKDIARVTFDLYRQNPKDVFGSLNVKGTFSGRYSVSADFQCLGPKKVLREALRMASNLLQMAGHMLITSANLIKRIIEGAEFWQPQRVQATEYWN
uniref:LOW QUALITY PROTEIN: cell death activator CIDE-B n=1 Tax=Oncorhynchus gorbuscha TaxID=8017 RepID=UPI001EAF5DC0|nr:LOW QUALITY PROTEIN: cell death activator CIDE-B [Oncorhynchus gorbuscha]